MEEWKDIFESDYKISTFGRVCNKNGKIMLPKIEGSSYKYLTITLRGVFKCKTFTISRLVAIHFIDNPDNLECVLHIDDNPLNNSVENLKWGSVLDNINDRQIKNRQAVGNKQHLSKLNDENVILIRSMKGRYKVKKIADMFNVSQSAIYSVLSNSTWKHI